ncbi:MAG: ATP-binding protein [Pseudomonadota bacterium]
MGPGDQRVKEQKSGLRGEQWRKVFSRRYTLALLLLASVWSVVSIVQYRTIMAERSRASVIAMAAEQAALSQRIAFLITDNDLDERGCTRSVDCAELFSTIGRMQDNHLILTGQTAPASVRPHLKPLTDIYQAGVTPFALEVDNFLYAAKSLSTGAMEGMDVDAVKLRERIKSSGMNTLMQTHSLLTEVLEAEAARSIQGTAFITAAAWLVSLIVLALISQKVLRPMADRLFETFADMEKAKQEALLAAETAERANRVRGEFLKTASHELKTPLNAIMGLAEVIRHGEDNADRLLSEMSHASDHLLSMLNTMLDSHKIDEGKLQITESEVALADELHAIAQIAADFTERKGLRFESCFNVPSTIRVKTDPQRLRQVCLNLLDNAARFTEEGEVCFSGELVDRCGQLSLKLVVEDTGVGIEKERLAQIFDRFSSVASVDDATSGGLGLGLSFTKTVVDMLGGSVDLRSEVGQGTCFELLIPVHAVFGNDAGQLQDESPTVKRVLIVDDNMPNRMVAEAMVQLMGGETVLAEDGQQAVDRAASERFDLILMDISMPVMDGITATQKIRGSMGPNQFTPIVAVTAHVAQEEVPDLINRGFQAVVHKPMRKNLMETIFDEYTGERGTNVVSIAGGAA